MNERVFIGLGANLGEAAQTLKQAILDIQQIPEVRLVGQSSFYASAPVDAQGPDFVNAVVEVQTALEPMALLQALQIIEQRYGRQRSYQNAPRTLDLDLLMYGQRQVALPDLVLPHPRMHLRAFVLYPLAELWPDAFWLSDDVSWNMESCMQNVGQQRIEVCS
jgi:2-amino-4-hydroxy-6-hydroxymethyldihydropteridine diphosphokinase